MKCFSSISSCDRWGMANLMNPPSSTKVTRYIPSDMVYLRNLLGKMGLSKRFSFPFGLHPHMVALTQMKDLSQYPRTPCDVGTEPSEGFPPDSLSPTNHPELQLLLGGDTVFVSLFWSTTYHDSILSLGTSQSDVWDFNVLFIMLWMLRLESLQQQSPHPQKAREQYPFIWGMVDPWLLQSAQTWKVSCLAQIRIRRMLRSTLMQIDSCFVDITPLIFGYANLLTD